MQQRNVGRSGLQVSWLGLGTNRWGRDVSPDDAAEMLRLFLDAGGTLLDSADVYTEGESERVIGALLSDGTGLADRDDVVIATKAGFRRVGESDGPVLRPHATRRHLLTALDRSLARLGTDHVDLWQVHAWDPYTPLEETLSALDTAVASGRAAYVGVSNFSGWQTARAATLQSAGGSSGPSAWQAGRAPIVAAQVEWSLLERGVEREVVPACLSLGVGAIAWASLGRGVLTGKYQHGTPPDSRGASRHLRHLVDPYLDTPGSAAIVEATVTAAEGLGLAPSTVALAWLRERPALAAALVGPRTPRQLADLLNGADVLLPEQVLLALDEVSAPVAGYPEVARA